jgi:DNA-binding CsgD family transcriptional regulator
MIIHESDYLEMYFDEHNSLSIQTWKKSPESSLVFKNEMRLFVSKYKDIKPTKALWLHKDFTLILDDETQMWTEKNVIEPCLKAGNSKLAFVVSKDVFSHLSVINSLDDAEMPNTPRHFTTEGEALQWLNNEKKESPALNAPHIHFDGLDENRNFLLKINTSSDIADVLRLFNALDEKGKLDSKKHELFKSLTDREKEILLCYSKGLETSKIAERCNVSIHTVRTHWRNIKKKLKIRKTLETLKFVRFY